MTTTPYFPAHFFPSTPHGKEDGPKEECGIFGIWGHPDAAPHAVLGLHALQHRGQEAAGIVSFDGSQYYAHRALGLVGDNFNRQDLVYGLKGKDAIGHVRYSTAGETMLRNVQPLFAELGFGGLALAHNGNLTNAFTLRQKLIAQGHLFQSTSDTEVIIQLMAMSHATSPVDKFVNALQQVEGAYSLVVLCDGVLMAARDPLGVRPLVLGQLGDSYVVASETCAFDIIGATYVRSIDAGEVLVIDEAGVKSIHPFPKKTNSRFCIFEYVYFARPDSVIDDRGVYEGRKQIGRELAKESHIRFRRAGSDWLRGSREAAVRNGHHP